MSRRKELRSLTTEFLDAFNQADLDRMMSFFAPDGAVYDEFNGTASTGLEAIRAAFAPQFAGAFGEMKFLDEDLFIDADAGKVMASWKCTLEVKGEPAAWRGLDLLHWEGDKVVRKLTYAKAKAPLFEQ
ncbi:MAG: nuclear transport factor 2 family protein [Actinomycetota bacterium]